MDDRINFDMFANMPSPNLLPTTRSFVSPKMALITLNYLKLVIDFMAIIALVFGVDYSIKNKCCLDHLCGSLCMAMMVVLCSDVQTSIVKAITLSNFPRARVLGSEYSFCRQSIIVITLIALCMSVSLPNTSIPKFTILPYSWYDTLLYIELVIVGLLWLGVDYVIVWKASKDYYSFEKTVLAIFQDNALKQCTCNMKNGDTDLPLKTTTEKNAQTKTEILAEEQNSKV